MTEENQFEPEAQEEAQPMPLVDRLERCLSRKAGRETIAKWLEENELDAKEYLLSPDELMAFDRLK